MNHWSTAVVAMFTIGLTIYIVAEHNDNGGWIYLLLLLMGVAFFYKDFQNEMKILGFLSADTGAPNSTPGRGPY